MYIAGITVYAFHVNMLYNIFGTSIFERHTGAAQFRPAKVHGTCYMSDQAGVYRGL